MYGVFTYIYHKKSSNVDKYTILDPMDILLTTICDQPTKILDISPKKEGNVGSHGK